MSVVTPDFHGQTSENGHLNPVFSPIYGVPCFGPAQIGVVFQTGPAIIRAPMKILLHLFLLVGMSPGAFLPSSITDQLIAPVATGDNEPAESAETDSTSGNNDGSTSSQESPSVLVVPSTYSAIRPPGLQFSKGDLRSTFSPHNMPLLGVLFRVELMPEPIARLVQQSGLLELDFCDALDASINSPEICAHAPPTLS